MHGDGEHFNPKGRGLKMTDTELAQHLEFVDGIQKAQMVALRVLLRELPNVKVQLQQYAEQLREQSVAEDLSEIQLEAMQTHLLSLAR